MGIRLKALVELLGGQLAGNADTEVSGIAPLDVADATQISFLSNSKFKAQAAQSKAAALILAPADDELIGAGFPGARIVTSNPYAYFARAAQVFAAQRSIAPVIGIHPSAVVDPLASVAATASVVLMTS